MIARYRSFREDHRGAIMVIGIFFACMMVGWMWMLVGLGDAVIWRDRSQEAADAITYSSSAIQAKGMNMISFMNVVMMIIAGIYVLLALVYNVLDFLHVFLGSTDDGGSKRACKPPVNVSPIPGASCIFSVDWHGVHCNCPYYSSAKQRALDEKIAAVAVSSVAPFLATILGYLSQYWEQAAGIVQNLHTGAGMVLGPYELLMRSILPPMSTTEDVVAYGAPWAGAVEGTYIGTKYIDWNESRTGTALGASMFPATVHPGTAGNLFQFAPKYKALEPDCNNPAHVSGCQKYIGGDKRQGLPVEIPDDGMGALCTAASKAMLAPVQDWINNAPVVSLIPGLSTVLGWILDSIADKAEESFCKHDSEGIAPWDEDLAWLLQPATSFGFPLVPAVPYLSGGINNTETCPNNNWGYSGGGSGQWGWGGPGTCNGVFRIKMKNGANFWDNPQQVGGPHVMVGYASNGNDWMQTWGIVYGGNRKEQSEKLVAVAGMDSNDKGTWKANVPQNSDKTFPLYFAQSEFYFDCEEGWTNEECNGGTGDGNLASYRMSWRARLRRVRGLSWAQDAFQYLWGGVFNSGFDTHAIDLLKNAGQFTVAKSVSDKFSGFFNTTAATGIYGALKDYAGDAVGGAINPATVLPDTIH